MNAKDDVLVVLCTFPHAEVARQAATTLVERRLAACVNLLPGVESIYRWQGDIETAEEVVAIFKTTAARFPALEADLRALHPYEVPEILALPVAAGAEAYLAWVAREVAP